MKNQSILLGALTLSAILLAVILLATPNPEAKGVMTSTAGDITMVTAGAPVGDETLTIIDGRSQKMVVYRLNNKTLEPIARMTSAGFDKAFARPNSK